jgi:hypothetical protein
MKTQKKSGAITVTAVEKPARSAKNSDEAPLELSLKSLNCILRSPANYSARLRVFENTMFPNQSRALETWRATMYSRGPFAKMTRMPDNLTQTPGGGPQWMFSTKS